MGANPQHVTPAGLSLILQVILIATLNEPAKIYALPVALPTR